MITIPKKHFCKLEASIDKALNTKGSSKDRPADRSKILPTCWEPDTSILNSVKGKSPSWGGRVSHRGGAWRGALLLLTIFFQNPPHQNRCPPMGHPPIWKTTPPPLKHETPFHEMIPRKRKINNNLKSS